MPGNYRDSEKESEKGERTVISPFLFEPKELVQMISQKNLDTLRNFGGIAGVLRGLDTSHETGLRTSLLSTGTSTLAQHEQTTSLRGHDTIHSNEVPVMNSTPDDRRRVYGLNVLPKHRSKPLLFFIWKTVQKRSLILLCIAAAISLAIGLFQDFGTTRKPGDSSPHWVESTAIMAAVMIVVLFGSLYDWRKARQFMALNEKKEERGVKVVRDGAESIINVTDVLVGDVALLEPGEIIPCDGIYLSGHNVQCNESVATGEADAIRKTTYEELVRLEAYDEAESDCFMISGSKVLEGIGRYVIVAVGRNSVNGRAMMATHKDPEETHLQIKLKGVARFVTIIGSMAGGLLFTEHMIRFFVQLGTRNPQRTPTESVVAVVNILILSVALIVLVIPEGHIISLFLPGRQLHGCRLTTCCHTDTRFCNEEDDIRETSSSRSQLLRNNGECQRYMYGQDRYYYAKRNARRRRICRHAYPVWSDIREQGRAIRRAPCFRQG